jgi:dihydrolipoamide dehydrogenase
LSLAQVTDVKMDIDKMMKNKAKAVTGLTGGIEGLFKKNKVTYVKGFGSLASPNSVSVALNAGGQQTIEAKNIIIAVGSEVTPLPTVPVDNAGESQSPTLVSHSYPISRAKDR